MRKRPQAPTRKFLVIRDDRANSHAAAISAALSLGCLTGVNLNGSLMSTVHPLQPVRLPIVRLAAEPYNAFSRSEEFCRPMPKASNVPLPSPGPSSSTDTTNDASSLRTDTHSEPPASRGSTP